MQLLDWRQRGNYFVTITCDGLHGIIELYIDKP